MANEFPQTLTIAGTDSGGGAGVMADLKTMQERQVFGTAVVVAVTAQNTLGVQDFMALPQKLIDEQFASLAADLKISACKTGMLADAAHVHGVVENLKRYDFGPLTVDPVMIAKGGAALLADDAVATVRDELVPLADVLTPDQASDFVLLADGRSFWLSAPRVDTVRTHGTGDTLSSCITAELAKGADFESAIRLAKDYVTAAIAHPIAVGHGHGPLNHWAYNQGGTI